MIDYDVGDLVVCVDDSPSRSRLSMGEPSGLIAGAVHEVTRFNPPETIMHDGLRNNDWGVDIDGRDTNYGAERFRKLRKKPQEFFAGEHERIDA